MTRDYLSVDDLDGAELEGILELAGRMKADRSLHATALIGKAVALIFEKASTRTRVSFEVGVGQLGGYPLTLSAADLQLGRGETIEDTGRVLSRYVDAIVLRTFEQERLEVLAAAADVPVVNSLSDFEHPCQALADLLTIREHRGALAGTVLTYVGDGNNVAHSLLLAGAKAAMTVRVATPAGFAAHPAGRGSRLPDRRGDRGCDRDHPPSDRRGRRRPRAVHRRWAQHGPGGGGRRTLARVPAVSSSTRT